MFGKRPSDYSGRLYFPQVGQLPNVAPMGLDKVIAEGAHLLNDYVVFVQLPHSCYTGTCGHQVQIYQKINRICILCTYLSSGM